MKKLIFFISLANCMIFNFVFGDHVLQAVKQTLIDYLRPQKLYPSVEMTTLELIKKDGYPAEAHIVLSNDGYLQTVHRIPGAPGSPNIILQHGFLSSSAEWVIPGKNKGLAYILADAGYDVWLTNARGNMYSRSNINYLTSDDQFWDFSWHEMGVYDLPAVISHITKMKGGNISYVGYSMGTTMFYVMATEKPEVASKINVMISLAPIAFLNHAKTPFAWLAPAVRIVELVIHVWGNGVLLPESRLFQFLAKYVCDVNLVEEKICANILFAFVGFDETEFDFTLIPLVFGHYPVGSSIKTGVHFLQLMHSGRFQPYDHGSEENMKKYNSSLPPEYDLSRIKVPIALFWGENDWLADPTDVKRLSDRLPNVIKDYKVDFSKFNHFDFLWSVNVKTLLYNELLTVLKNYGT